jgi:hypothetical protein
MMQTGIGAIFWPKSTKIDFWTAPTETSWLVAENDAARSAGESRSSGGTLAERWSGGGEARERRIPSDGGRGSSCAGELEITERLGDAGEVGGGEWR